MTSFDYMTVIDAFLDKVRNHLFLQQHLSAREMMGAIAAQKAMTLESLRQVSDQMELLMFAQTEEQYTELMRAIDEAAAEELRGNAEAIAQRCGMPLDACGRILERAIEAEAMASAQNMDADRI